MKKLLLILGVASCAFMADAQQLPSVGFEEPWVKSYPWNSVYSELSLADALALMGQTVEGVQPAGWIASNVLGVVSETDNGGYGALGSTEVGTKAEGYNSNTAVNLKNNPNPFMSTQIVPAYLSLGKTWATNGLDFATFSPKNKDGGAFGGLEFTERPDAISFYYKRAHGTDKPAEKATVVVYSWKGTWTQADVPGNNTMSDAQIVKVDMIDRDRNILGIATDQGGEVTHTDDAELISKLIDHIEGDAAEWTKYEQPIEYLSDATPEKINVIIAANDYFNANEIGNGNEITLDDVRLVYYSRLKSLKIGDTEVALEDGKYDYTVNGTVPTDVNSIVYEVLGQSATAEVAVYDATNKVVITVKNLDADSDGQKEHVYTISFGAQQSGDKYDGKVTIELFGSDITDGGQDATIEIVSTGDNTCTLMLPNFTLASLSPEPIGDIVVPNVTIEKGTDADTYTGHVDGLKLMNDMITANVDLNGTIDTTGKADFTINVIWDNNGTEVPILVKFNGQKRTLGIDSITTEENAPVEYYNLQGVRIANPTAGLYIVKQGKKVSKQLIR